MLKNKFILTITLLIFTANAGLCEQTRTVAVQDLMIKFIIAMVGVMLASFVIWAGLAVYNKILIKGNTTASDEEILKTPKTTEEAIRFFIQKNKLK